MAALAAAVLTLNTLIQALPKVMLAAHHSSSVAGAGGSDCHCDRTGEGSVCAPVIDIVYTWVNGSDAAFSEQLKKYKTEWLREHGEDVDGSSTSSSSSSRSRSHSPPPPPPPPSPPSPSPSPPPPLKKNNKKNKGRSSSYNSGGHRYSWEEEDEEDGDGDGDGEKKSAAEEDADAVSASRFSDHQELRYSLRSVWMHAPWVRNVYIVTNGQVPTWLDLSNPRVKVVPHSTIFPNTTHLPTFSSPAIETHIHRIPGLSDKFLYLNDDVMFGREVWPDDFATTSRGQKIYLAWPVPHCAETCSPHYLGDGMCDKGCNTTLCNFDMGDCTGDDVKVRHGWGYGSGYDEEEEETNKCGAVGRCNYQWVGDKYCDKACLTLDCGYDAGDCGTKLMRANMVAVEVNGNTTLIELNATEPSLMLNLTGLYPKGQITAASHSNEALVAAASVSQKFALLTLVFSADGSNSNTSVVISLSGKGRAHSLFTQTTRVALDLRLDRGKYVCLTGGER